MPTNQPNQPINRTKDVIVIKSEGYTFHYYTNTNNLYLVVPKDQVKIIAAALPHSSYATKKHTHHCCKIGVLSNPDELPNMLTSFFTIYDLGRKGIANAIIDVHQASNH